MHYLCDVLVVRVVCFALCFRFVTTSRAYQLPIVAAFPHSAPLDLLPPPPPPLSTSAASTRNSASDSALPSFRLVPRRLSLNSTLLKPTKQSNSHRGLEAACFFSSSSFYFLSPIPYFFSLLCLFLFSFCLFFI